MTIVLTTWEKAILIERENGSPVLVILVMFSIWGDIINHQ